MVVVYFNEMHVNITICTNRIWFRVCFLSDAQHRG